MTITRKDFKVSKSSNSKFGTYFVARLKKKVVIRAYNTFDLEQKIEEYIKNCNGKDIKDVIQEIEGNETTINNNEKETKEEETVVKKEIKKLNTSGGKKYGRKFKY